MAKKSSKGDGGEKLPVVPEGVLAPGSLMAIFSDGPMNGRIINIREHNLGNWERKDIGDLFGLFTFTRAGQFKQVKVRVGVLKSIIDPTLVIFPLDPEKLLKRAGDGTRILSAELVQASAKKLSEHNQTVLAQA